MTIGSMIQTHILQPWNNMFRITGDPAIALESGSLNTRQDRVDVEEQIEDFPRGYPRYSALVASDESFHICRAFSFLRTRLLLLKQDRLVTLEKRLRAIDNEEATPLFLAAARQDRNTQRRETLQEIDTALSDYDNFLNRASHTLSFKQPNIRNVTSLQNWLQGTAALTRDESAYLNVAGDLVSLTSQQDGLATAVENMVEDCLIRFHKGFRSLPGNDRSRDTHVYLYSGTLVRLLTHIVISILVAFLLVVPITACYLVQSVPIRLMLILLSTLTLMMTMLTFYHQRSVELFMVGATYCTVLVVFLSSTASTSS